MELTDGIIAIWHGNNTDIDSSGHDHNLTRVGATFDGAVQKLGSHSFSFDGSDDYLSQDDAVFRMEYSQPWSVGMWIRPGGTLNGEVIGNLDSSLGFRGWGVNLLNGAPLCSVVNRLSPSVIGVRVATSAPVFTLNVWSCFVLTWTGNGLESGFEIYVDDMASPKAKTVYSDNLAGATAVSTKPLLMGVRDPLSNDYAGKLDEVVMWDRALTSDNRQAFYNGGAGVEIVMPRRGMRTSERGISTGGPS